MSQLPTIPSEFYGHIHACHEPTIPTIPTMDHPPIPTIDHPMDHPDVITTVDLEGFVKMATRTEPGTIEYSRAHNRLDNFETLRLLHVALGLCTEAGEFADQLKKHIFYGKDLDYVNLIEETGDSSWYMRIACDALEVSFQEMLTRNVLKLQKRFPDRFTEHDAKVRDLNSERQVLEGGQK